MKKIVLFGLMMLFSLTVMGCDFFGGVTTTTVVTQDTTEPTVLIEVSTEAELRAIDVTKSYRLMADIDLANAEWTPIGSHDAPFEGWFDGNGHTISNYVITDANADYNGLFGVATGNIKNLTIENFNITYTTDFMTYAGGLVGHMSGDIDNVNVSGTIAITNLGSTSYVGLLAGLVSAYLTSTMTVTQFQPGSVTNASAEGTLSIVGENFVYIGGLIGKAYNVHLDQTQTNVNITATSRNFRVYAGGLIGHNFSGILAGYEDIVEDVEITLENSHSNAVITLYEGGTWGSAGGLLGYNQYGVIMNSYAYARILLDSDDHHYIAGLIGEDWNGQIINSVASSLIFMTEDTTLSKNLNVSGLIASINDSTIVTNSFSTIGFSGTILDVAGEPVTMGTLTDASWFETILGWDGTLIDINQAISTLTQE